MDAVVSKELVDFIRRECGISEAVEISAQTGMQRDLGVYGDDAIEFLVAYGAHFHVDVTEFRAADYFGGEGWDILGVLLGLLRLGAWLPANQTRKELTVGHLLRGIEAKRLNEQAIGAA